MFKAGDKIRSGDFLRLIIQFDTENEVYRTIRLNGFAEKYKIQYATKAYINQYYTID